MNAIVRAAKLSAAVVVAAFFAVTPTVAAEIKVMVSGGFSAAYRALGPQFERETGHTLSMAAGPSMGETPQAIPNRIDRGEPVDVVIMVGDALGKLIERGKVVPSSRVDLARSSIAMAVRAGDPKPDISTLEAFKRALLEAKSIAYSDSASGIYLSTTLYAKLGIAEQVAGKSRKVRGPPSGEPVAAVVARGEAEIGFQQVSELIHVPGVTFVGAIPAELQQDTFFSAALANAVRQPEAAGALLRFLASSEAAPAISRAGLAPLSGR